VYVRKANNVLAVDRDAAAGLLGGASTDPSQLLTYTQKALDKLGIALASAKHAPATTARKKK
jgi:hypothetical protein